GAEDSHVDWGPTILATVVAGVIGYAGIAWFMRFISTRSFMPFVIYRVALGVTVLALIWFGLLDPFAGSTVHGPVARPPGTDHGPTEPSPRAARQSLLVDGVLVVKEGRG